MNLEELYAQLHGNYTEAKSRLMNDRLVEKFVVKFLSDSTYQQILDGIAAGDRESTFRAVHTLKGVAANLGFTELQQNASNLTEQLRDRQSDPDPVLLDKVKESYQLVVDTIKAAQ